MRPARPARTAGAGARPPTGRSRRRAGRGRTGCAAASRWGRRRARARPSRRAPRRCRSGPAAGGARPRAAWLSATASRTRRPRTRPRRRCAGRTRRDGGRPPRRSAWMRTSSLARRQRALPWRRNRSRARPARRRASWASPPSSATSARVSSTSPTSCQARSRLSCRGGAGQGLVRLGVQAGGQEHPRAVEEGDPDLGVLVHHDALVDDPERERQVAGEELQAAEVVQGDPLEPLLAEPAGDLDGGGEVGPGEVEAAHLHVQGAPVDEQAAAVHPRGEVEVLGRGRELLQRRGEPATAEEEQRVLAVDEPEQVVGAHCLRPAGRLGHPDQPRVDAADLDLGLRQRGEDARDGGQPLDVVGRARRLGVRVDPEQGERPRRRRGAGRRPTARVVGDGLLVPPHGVATDPLRDRRPVPRGARVPSPALSAGDDGSGPVMSSRVVAPSRAP